eukprot:m.196405 g.196405  ORF g.196405 m.196405 type:complete len:289 (+) comp19798_c0_seq1:214-1080(+)
MATTVKGKVCVVTGGGSGIGEAICRAFAAAGAEAIAVVDITRAKAETVAVSLRCPETNQVIGRAYGADCASETALWRMITRVEYDCGPIDVCVANAGILASGGAEVPNGEWKTIMGVNVMQHVYLARHLIPRFKERGGGRFVITASAAGLLTQVGSFPYSVTKAAAVSVAEWLAITHYDDNISVHVVCPQAVNTPFIGDLADTAPSGKKSGGVAGLDGVIEANDVANELVVAMESGRFMVLPHKTVQRYIENKAKDYDRWIAGMRKLHTMFGKSMLTTPAFSGPNAKL